MNRKAVNFFLIKKRKPGKCPNYTFCSADCCSSALLQNICRWLSTSHLLPQNGIAHSRHAVQCPQIHLFTKAVHDHMCATVSPQRTACELIGLTHETQSGDASGIRNWESEKVGAIEKRRKKARITFHCTFQVCSLTLQSMLMRKFPVVS